MSTTLAQKNGSPIAITVPTGIESGDPILLGVLPGVAVTSRNSNSGKASVDFENIHFLEVVADSVLSPESTSAVKPGDAIYADGGTLDSGTNVKHSFTLDKNSSTGVFFGNALDAIAAGETATIRVKLPGGKAA